jgi:hypothetical protein
LVLFTAFGVVADLGRGSFPVRYAIPAGVASVSVSTAGGDLSLRRAAPGAGSLTGNAHYSLVKPNVTEQLTGGRAAFGYKCHEQFGDCGLDATLSVPGGTTVSADTGGGNITATGISGRVTISTGGGELSANDITGDLSLDADGGNITATSVAAPQLTADTGGGDITATAVQASQVIANTGGGNVEIVFTTVPRDVQISTGGGNVTIVVPPGTTQYHVIATPNGGTLTTDLPTAPSSPNVITATTSGGNITLQQSP